MSTLGKAVVEYSADTAKFISDVGRTAAAFDKGMARMEAGVTNLRNAFVAVAGLGGFGALIKSAIDAGDQLGKLSQKVGITVERLSELKLGAELADVSLDALTIGLKEFNKSLAEARDPNSKAAGIFAALGVDPNESPDAALRKFADAMSKMEDGATKTAVATELMGKAGMNMIPWLNQGAAGMDKAAQSARNLGLVMSAEFAAQSEQFNDNLKLLSKNTDALAVQLAGGLIGGLTTLTGRLVESREKGEGFLGFLKEAVLLATALGERLFIIPQGISERIFSDLRHQGGSMGGPVTGLIRGPDGKPINQGTGGPAPNPDAVACAASGGKWVNGQCVRTGSSSDNLVGRQWAEDQEEWNKIMAESAQATDNYYAGLRAEEKRVEDERMKAWLEFIDREREREEIEMRALAGFDAMGNAIKKTTELTDRLGFTFASAFEDAIVQGRRLSSILKGLAQDVARIFIREGFTRPAANFLSGMFAGYFGGSAGSSAAGASGGESIPTDSYFMTAAEGGTFKVGGSGGIDSKLVGFQATPGEVFEVTPPGESRGGGSSVINFNVQAIDSRSFVSMLADPANRRALVRIVRDAQLRGES